VTLISRGRLRAGAAAIAILLVVGVVASASVVASTRVPVAAGPPALPADSPAPTPPGVTSRVSIGDNAGQGNAGSGGVNDIITASNGDQAISADGRWVAFVSVATNLIPGEDHPNGGLFLRDRQDGRTIAVPWVDAGVFPALVQAAEPSLSADGSVVAFTAIVSRNRFGAVAGTSIAPYVLLWDRTARASEVVSLDDQGEPTPGYQPSISGDGLSVAYTRWFVAPAPTTATDTTPPSLSNLTTTGFPSDGQFYVFGPSAPCTPHDFTISVTATDPDDAVSAVTLFIQPSGGSVFSVAMSPAGGTTWQANVGAQDAWNVGVIAYWVQAVDSHGNTSPQLFSSGGNTLNKGSCIL
jgi:hypothetical protein